MKSYFYPKSIYTAVSAFSEIFSSMSVRVYDPKTGDIVGVKPVPIMIAPKSKIASILKVSQVNDVDPQSDNYLPRISVNMTGMSWNPERMRGKNEKRLINIEYEEDGSSKKMQTDTQPVPYNLTFEVTVWTKYLVDGWQIIENIVPFFAPEMHLSFKERNFGLEHKARVVLDSLSQNHVYEYGENEREVLQWNLQFTMEASMWKPMELTKEILCSQVRIANVPCKRVPFQGTNVIAYEPIRDNYLSVADSAITTILEPLDANKKYELMVDYWTRANNTMVAFNNCIETNCVTDPGPKPEFDPSLNFDNSKCATIMKKPCIEVDSQNGYISNYWQEQIVDGNNLIQIVSYRRVYSNNGEDISGPDIININEYPQCWIDPIPVSSSSSYYVSSSSSYSSSSSNYTCTYETQG